MYAFIVIRILFISKEKLNDKSGRKMDGCRVYTSKPGCKLFFSERKYNNNVCPPSYVEFRLSYEDYHGFRLLCAT